MPEKVKINITDKYKKDFVFAEAKVLVRKACRATLKNENFEGAAQIDVTFVGDPEIKAINREFRDIDKSTDVLSFPLGENGVYDINPENGAFMLGDVVISVDHARAQAELYGHGIEREIAFLTIHSVLHLLGYDHVGEESERKIMRKKEEEILESMGLSVDR
ncbi:MAG: rRNA maturation RNase YbeY [Clostridia bacterium]|nr:rRNA maturation RNase YbeY [Clostridia bacterium]